MYSVNLQQGKKFKMNNSIYEILRREKDLIHAIDLTYGDTKVFTTNELIKELSSGTLRFEVSGKNIKREEKSLINTRYEFDDLLSEPHKDEAVFRYNVIKPLLSIAYSGKDIEARCKEINTLVDNPTRAMESLKSPIVHTVSRATMYRWIKNYQESGGDMRSLLPSYYLCGGNNKSRKDSRVFEILDDVINDIYKLELRVSRIEAYDYFKQKIFEYNSVASEKLKSISYDTFVRRIKDISSFELINWRIGKKTADKLYCQKGNSYRVTRPLERVEIDTTPIDGFYVIDINGNKAERPHLVMAIDKFTRYPLGFSVGFGHAGWIEVMNCIRHIMHDKSYVKKLYPDIKNAWNAFGKPSTIFIDNGKEFKNKEMFDSCLTLGIELNFAPKGTPAWKGSIERFFRTANTGFIHQTPGTTRSNPQQKGDNENPKKDACIKLGTFIMLLHKWIIDVYAQREHKGIHAIPAKIWDDKLTEYPVAWPNSLDEIAIALGRIEKRRIKSTGIELKGLYYNCSNLYKLYLKFNENNNGAEKDFKIKFDPLDIGYIYLYDNLISKEWIKIPAVYQEYASGLSEWEHDEIRKYVRKKYCQVNEAALCEAKAFIRDTIKNAMGYKLSQIAKIRKINSTSETIDHTNANNSNVTCQIKFSMQNNISGSGYKISDGVINSGPNVVSIDKPRTDQKKAARNKDKPKSITDEPLSKDDLVGFSIEEQ